MNIKKQRVVMIRKFLSLLILPILINAANYHSIEAARERSAQSLQKSKTKPSAPMAPTTKDMAQTNKRNIAVPRAINKVPKSVAGLQCAPPFYRPVHQKNCGHLRHDQIRAGNPNKPMTRNCTQENSCPQNTISTEMDKKITEYAYRYDLGPEEEEDMKTRAGYDELMVEEMQILDEINVDDTIIPKIEPVVCRKRGCPYYKCYRKKNCTCC